MSAVLDPIEVQGTRMSVSYDWEDAIRAHAQCGCRVATRAPHLRGECDGPLEHAHVSGRRHDEPRIPGSNVRYVHPDSVVKLCRAHHRAYDRHELDLLPYLTVTEQARAVLALGSIQAALIHIGGGS